MFVIYNEDTKCVENLHLENMNYSLSALRIESINKSMMILKGIGMLDLVLDIDNIRRNGDIITCSTSLYMKFIVNLKCIDCGVEAAEWISRYLNRPNIRLAYTEADAHVKQTFWECLAKTYETIRDDRDLTISSASVPTYTLISNKMLHEWNSKYDGCPKTIEEFQPNIVIWWTSPCILQEIEWEWIKIGDAIIRNIIPWSRQCTKMHPRNIPMDMTLDMYLLHCELYIPAEVHVNDNVYVHIPMKNYKHLDTDNLDNME
ncbi:hypothetical protein EAI_03024 [Harpegnathos saltator]|uniref:Uncharacterized protein n=2 Tax=Harpegnathos saltator TaxID=610380 RepID=E2BE09_HARSA|nr:hypothetical protein EAI_03024 [Harpegnathos saltator]